MFGVSGAHRVRVPAARHQRPGSSSAAFSSSVQDQAAHRLEELASATQDLIRRSQGRKDLVSLFTPFTANDPQYLVTIDREKAKSLHVPLQQITDTLQVYMGSAYVNDFDFNNRSYRVYVQADQQFRAAAKDMQQFYVRSDSGAMIPLENLVNITQTTTPQVITHYNLFRSAEIDGSAAPGYSSGQAIAAMDELAKKDAAGLYLYLDGALAGGNPVGRNSR